MRLSNGEHAPNAQPKVASIESATVMYVEKSAYDALAAQLAEVRDQLALVGKDWAQSKERIAELEAALRNILVESSWPFVKQIARDALEKK